MILHTSFKSPERVLLYSQTADQIKAYIRKHDLQPGDRLPGERTLSSLLQISRNSVREGLRLLQTQGVISVKTGSGSFVEHYTGNDTMFFQILTHNFAEMLEVKSTMERHIIETLVQTLTEPQKDFLRQIAMEMNALADQGIYPQELDWKFHKSLAEFQSNGMIREIMSELIQNLDEYWKTTDHEMTDLVDTVPYHIQLIDCLCSGDKAGALSSYDQICEIDIHAMQELLTQNGGNTDEESK